MRSLVLPWSVYQRVAGGTLLISLSTKPHVVMIHRKVRGHSQSDTLFFFYKNVVFQGQAEYSYFSADFRL